MRLAARLRAGVREQLVIAVLLPATVLLPVAVLAGCSSPAPVPSAPAEQATTEEAAATAADHLVMRGIKLYLYEGAATPGVERSPSFSVEAEEFVQEANKTWRFTQARATVPSKQEGQAPIIFDAGVGELREEESARLEGGVKATVGAMTIDMDNVQWLQAAAEGAGMASSDAPVSVVDPTMNLFAQQFRLYPAEARFILQEVNGEVAFTAPQPEGAAAEESTLADEAPEEEGKAAS